MSTRFNHRARRSERTRLLSERTERLNVSLNQKIKSTSKQTTPEKPECEQPEPAAGAPREGPYDRILRRLREDRGK
jgi:hypothetical protein